MMNEIIVVGNGSSVLDKENGKTIDSFNIVVRFNNYKIKGFESFTGIKTDYWFTTAVYADQVKENYKRIYTHSWQWDPEKDIHYIKFVNNGIFPIKTTYQEIVEMMNYVENTKYSDYSTGSIALWMLLKEHSHIYITGFDWWEERDKHHYGDSALIGNIHKPTFEKIYIDKLISDNKVSFL